MTPTMHTTMSAAHASHAAPDAITIVIADDHPLIRAGMASLLQSEGSFTLLAQASDGEQAVELYERLQPDVLLLDLSMPNCDGIEATARIHARHSRARIIIMSAHEGEEVVYRCMQAGASAYLLKNAPFDELLACIGNVLEGRKVISPQLAAKLATRVHGSELSVREKEILMHLATGACNKTIARAAGIGVGTVKFHINNILSKLNAATRTEAVMQANRRGLLGLH